RRRPSSPKGPVITSTMLVDLGVALMDESRLVEGRPLGMADAVRYPDGLIIALLGFVPLRRGKLAALELNRSARLRPFFQVGRPIHTPPPQLAVGWAVSVQAQLGKRARTSRRTGRHPAREGRFAGPCAEGNCPQESASVGRCALVA